MMRSILSLPSILTAIVVAESLVGDPRRCAAQVTASEVAAPTASPTAQVKPGTPRQQQWLKASPDHRIRLAESLGDEGARAFAKSKGWKVIFDGTNRAIPQGLDQVYSAADGTIHVIEAKGGSSQLGHAYGHPQGSSEWAVESAKRMMRSPNASAAEKAAAETVLKAAAQGKLTVHVVRTSHVLGEPTAAVLQQTLRSSDDAARAAQFAIDDIARASSQVVDDAARAVDDAARVAATSTTTTTSLKTVAKGTVVVGVLVDGGLRVSDGIETERKFVAGEISVQQREVSHAKNAAGMAGGWGGAAGGAWVAGATAAPLAAMTGPAAPVVEGVAVVAGGVAGYIGGEAAAGAAAEWTVNRIHDAGTTVGGAASSAWSATASSASSTWTWATNW
jgi:hypothetical protein